MFVFVLFLAIRVLSENNIMIETLEKRETEIQHLRTENSGKRPPTPSSATFDCRDITETSEHARACVCVCVFAALNQQCSELISILDLREQRIFREMKPKYSQSRDAGALEVREQNI